jgi:hypothetical protein
MFVRYTLTQGKHDEMCLMFFFFLLALDVVVVNVTDKPHARSVGVSGDPDILMNISPININSGCNSVKGNDRLTNYPITYHGGSVMKTPGM